jgi:SanA protein
VKILAFMALASLAVALAAFGIVSVIQSRYESLITEVGAAPERPVAIVFGAGIRTGGRLSPILKDRMDTAIALYDAGKVRKLLVSGDNSTLSYNEPGAMYDYAVMQGVPPNDVVRDYAGRRTYDTCYRAGHIFGVSEAILVTQRFHLPRAIFTCGNLGVAAVGVAADRRPYRANSYYRLRDAVATLRAAADVWLLRPTPILGEKIDIGL